MKGIDPQIMTVIGGILQAAASQIAELQESLRIEKEVHNTALSGWRNGEKKEP